MNVLIVHDRLSNEPSQDELDTMIEVAQVSSALRATKHRVRQLPFSMNLIKMKEQIAVLRPDIVFNLVETLHGSSLLHLAPSLFESMSLRYTGGNSVGMMLSSDKLEAKKLMRMAGIKTPEWASLSYTQDLDSLINVPVIVKPVNEEASVGINDQSVCTFSTEASILDFLADRQGSVFIERFIDGREFNISVLSDNHGARVFPVAEMKFIDFPQDKPKIVGYAAKWEEESWEYIHTKRDFSANKAEPELIDRLQNISLMCWSLFGGKGYARVDLRVDQVRTIWVLEVNLNPCIAEDSGFVAAAGQAGISYKDLINKLLEG
ncbi:MAG: ATP-grasp domain-containing protein [Sphaerochaetaceae bacterium]|jgi:D-alanine-D-alanine ligase|nr:ATP-grasp domain-containing protein [Sphaerochaetaceae bacterium]NLO60759.1 ATP-grasp domain-containing protein [Spirochaetales bacterium]MDD2405887.1 ATP-grasp domain-containing protein [Sphaerochaetaceae bacterium]MDD4258255.1 ATP-grasp domain-containing protein [Sphaerochaetaceae bacterium]MDD4764046.1 ATP-grasp domain-containing protein [Sphaerochaetaceae bacterium]